MFYNKFMKKENSQIRLKKIMEDRGLRQVDILEKSKPFQDKLGIKMSKTHLSNYINGKSNPDQQKLILLSQTLGVSEPWLMGYDVPMVESSKIENDSEAIKETIAVMKQLEEPRRKVVLDTASSQLKEQEEQKSKIVSIKNEQQKQGIDLADLVDDSKVDWDKWVSFDGRPLTDDVKEAMKRLLGKRLEDK